MRRKKSWRMSESRRAELGEQEVLEWVNQRQNPASVQVQSHVSMQAQSPASQQIQSPASKQALSPASERALSPASERALSPASKQALSPASERALSPASERALSPASKQALSPASERALSPASERALSSASERALSPASKQALSPASERALSSASVQANASKLQKDLEKGNTQNEFTNNVSQKDNEKGKTTATCIDLALRQSTHSWNACQTIFGSYHQNDVRYSEQSRVFQFTGNALCLLSYSVCLYINNSSILDKVICDGDYLYQKIKNSLKADANFIHSLLSLHEIPEDFELEFGKFILEKQHRQQKRKLEEDV